MRALAAVLALTLAGAAPAPADRTPLSDAFKSICGAGPARPDDILAKAARAGWRPVAPADAPVPHPGFIQTAVWSKPSESHGRLFLLLGHGEAPFFPAGSVSDACLIVAPIHSVPANAKAIGEWAGAPLNTTLPNGQKIYLYATDATNLSRMPSPDANASHAEQALRGGKTALVTFVAMGHSATLGYFVQRH
jgi:hypothetical protein